MRDSLRFDGDILKAGDTEAGRIWINRGRWHWQAVTSRPGRAPSGSAYSRTQAKRELRAYVTCAARENRRAA